MEDEYSYDSGGNRLSRRDARPGQRWTNTDWKYEHDNLDRLTEAKRGSLSTSGTLTLSSGSQKWALDMLGNWTSVFTDNNGVNAYADSGEEDRRTHNSANELTNRQSIVTPPAIAPQLPFTYDDAGNMREQKLSGTTTREYTHDAWNRLLRVRNRVSTVPTSYVSIGRYEYNALHWRTRKLADTSTTNNGLDQQRTMWYSASWQVLQEDVDDFTNCNADGTGGCTPTPNGTDRVYQQFWGLRYIDDAVMRRVDANADGDFSDANDKVYFHLTDVQFSTVAMVSLAGQLSERTSYTPYGEARHRFAADVNNDGSVTSADLSIINAAAAANGGSGTPLADPANPDTVHANYNAAADIDWSGGLTPEKSESYLHDYYSSKSMVDKFPGGATGIGQCVKP